VLHGSLAVPDGGEAPGREALGKKVDILLTNRRASVTVFPNLMASDATEALEAAGFGRRRREAKRRLSH
jgi:hypothetical protein